MIALSNSERMNLSNAKALRRARELLKVTRNQLADSLKLTDKSIEKYENGRVQLDEEGPFSRHCFQLWAGDG